MLYGCDGAWWRRRNGVPEFRGVKVCQDANTCIQFADLCKVEIPNERSSAILIEHPGVLGGGGNSGFQALNLAVQFGATRIVLIGFDMHGAGGTHWHGAHGAGFGNPSEAIFARWRRALDGVAPALWRLGVDVVNGSANSALCAYRKLSIERIIEEWGL